MGPLSSFVGGLGSLIIAANPAQEPVSSSGVISAQVAEQMAGIASRSIQEQLPPAATVLRLSPTSPFNPKQPFTAALTTKLKVAGYGIAGPGGLSPDSHVVSYNLSSIGQDLYLSVIIDGSAYSRLYRAQDDGQIVPHGPVSVRTNPRPLEDQTK
jgi:hypothetical protein